MIKEKKAIKKLAKMMDEVANEIIQEREKNLILTHCCGAYAKELDLMMTFIKSSEMRYQEWVRFQMEEFKKDNEVEA